MKIWRWAINGWTTLTARGDAGARKEFEQCAAVPVATVWTPRPSPTDVTAYCTQANAPDASRRTLGARAASRARHPGRDDLIGLRTRRNSGVGNHRDEPSTEPQAIKAAE